MAKHPTISMSAPVLIQAADPEKPKGPRTFSSTFYTGGALNVGGYDLPVIVDLSGLKASKVLVANLDHKQHQRVGNFDVVNDGKQLIANGVASASTPYRDEVVNSADDGYQWQTSLEVDPEKIEQLAKGKTATVNGQEFTGPKYITREGTLKGFGFVSHGADDNTTATIAASAASPNDKGNDMDPKFKAWVEAIGFDADTLSEDQKTGLLANFNGKTVQAAKSSSDPLEALKAKQARERAIYAAAERHAIGRGDDEIDAIIEMRDKAIKAEQSEKDFELEVYRLGIPGPVQQISAKRDSIAPNQKVLEAAICATYGYTKLEDKKYGFDDQTLQMAHDKYRHGIGLKQLFRVVARANGYNTDDDEVTMDMHRYACRLVPQNGGRSIQGANSTISIPGILSNVANKFLQDGWEAGDMTWQDVSSVRTVRDFKAVTSYKLSGSFKYEKVGSGGELKHGSIGEDSYTNQAETYGKMFGVSRTDIINDDLGAFTSILREMSFGAIDSFNEVFWTEFLADQSTFFAAGNNNTSAGVWSSAALATLTAAELVFMNQTQPNGRPLGMMPDRILVPPGAKRYALNAISSTQVVGTTGPTPSGNSFAGEYRVLSTPYIANSAFTGFSTVKWYMLCNPQRLSMIETCFLNGKQSPTVESAEAAFNTLGVQMRGYHDFGCNKQEYRSAVQGSGA